MNKPAENLEEQVNVNLEEQIKKLEDENLALKKYAENMKAFQSRMEMALAKALQLLLTRLTPFVNHNHYINTQERNVLLTYLGKLLAPIAQVLGGGQPEVFKRQLASLVKQTHSSFLDTTNSFEPNMKVTFNDVQYVVKDKNGKDPYVVQLNGETKGPLHKAKLSDFIQAIEEDERKETCQEN